MTESKIEWTDRSDWNPIRGCTRVSPGCGGPGPHGGCYAEKIAGRFSDPGQAFHGFATRAAGGRWTGKVAIVEERLTLPLRWRKPAKVFASSTSDIFHEALSDADIDRIFAVMALAPHLTFQVLTKRADRMRHYLRHAWAEPFDGRHEDAAYWRVVQTARKIAPALYEQSDIGGCRWWPLPNAWLGVSVEDQQRADERREHLRATPAAVRFVSYEPALGPVDWTGWEFVDQIIGGGESGPRARPMHPDWQRGTRDFCDEHGIAYFLKQNGEYAPGEIAGEYLDPDKPAKGYSYFDGRWGETWSHPEGHIDDEPDVYRVGKQRAGRWLDGILHDGMPARA